MDEVNIYKDCLVTNYSLEEAAKALNCNETDLRLRITIDGNIYEWNDLVGMYGLAYVPR